MSAITFHRLVEHELAEAARYYEGQATDLGQELLAEVRHAITFLLRYPEAARRVRGPVRRFVLPRFPYYLLYRPLAGGGLRVLTFAHHRQWPEHWPSRR